MRHLCCSAPPPRARREALGRAEARPREQVRLVRGFERRLEFVGRRRVRQLRPARGHADVHLALRHAVVVVQNYGVAALSGSDPFGRHERTEKATLHHLGPPQALKVPSAKDRAHGDAIALSESLTQPGTIWKAPLLVDVNGDPLLDADAVSREQFPPDGPDGDGGRWQHGMTQKSAFAAAQIAICTRLSYNLQSE